MRARYIALYRLPGIDKLPPGVSCCQLAAFRQPRLSATLVSDPAPYFEHIDNLSGLLMTLGRGPMASATESAQQRLANEIDAARRRREAGSSVGPFIVFDGETDICDEGLARRQEIGGVAFCINEVPRGGIRGKFQRAIESVILALILSMPPIADQRIETVGSVAILIDRSTGKVIYPISVVGNPIMISRAVSISPEVLTTTERFANSINAKKILNSSISLLFASLGSKPGDPIAFVTAWAALETFVHGSYDQKKEVIEAAARKSSGSTASHRRSSSSDAPVIVGLTKKFSAIARSCASSVSEDDTRKDIDEFKSLKKSRDSFYHRVGESIPDLPVEQIQKILRKYMRLYFCQTV